MTMQSAAEVQEQSTKNESNKHVRVMRAGSDGKLRTMRLSAQPASTTLSGTTAAATWTKGTCTWTKGTCSWNKATC